MKTLNLFQKGQDLEKSLSLDFHQKSIPLLIEPKLLRKRGAGQVDLARFVLGQNQKYIELLEVKSGTNVSDKQRLRLRASADFIGEVFKVPVKLLYSLRTNR